MDRPAVIRLRINGDINTYQSRMLEICLQKREEYESRQKNKKNSEPSHGLECKWEMTISTPTKVTLPSSRLTFHLSNHA